MKSLQDKRCYKGFTDGVDVSFEISLFEYGIIRNPKTCETVFCHNRHLDPETLKDADLDCQIITIEEVKSILEEQTEGFFSFIGSDKETEINSLDNNYLSGIISSIDSYDGSFTS